MGLANLIYNAQVPENVVEGLGARRLKSGLFSFAGEGSIKRWNVAEGRAKARIHSYVEVLDADFGDYHAHFTRMYYQFSRVRVTGKSHPHFSGSLCWGNMGAARDYALEMHDIEIVAGLVATTLSSYYPGDAFPGWWGSQDTVIEMKCIMCGGDGADYQCSVCRSDLCGDCVKSCEITARRTDRANHYCKHCVVDTLCKGESCNIRWCWNHPGKKKVVFEPLKTGNLPGHTRHSDEPLFR